MSFFWIILVIMIGGQYYANLLVSVEDKSRLFFRVVVIEVTLFSESKDLFD